MKSQGEPITHVVGGGELRIQPPLPPKAVVAAKPGPNPRHATEAGRGQAAQPPGAVATGEEGADHEDISMVTPSVGPQCMIVIAAEGGTCPEGCEGVALHFGRSTPLRKLRTCHPFFVAIAK